MNKRADGLYQSMIVIGKTEEGKRITKTFYGKTQKEVKAKIEEYKRSEKQDKHTLKKIAEAYLADIDDSTLKYRISAFTDVLGNEQISDINAIDIEKILRKIAVNNTCTNKPTSERTLTRYLNAFNQVFTYAERNRIITFNPCKYVRMPKTTPPTKREAITREDIKKIENCDHKARIPALIMIYSGLRRGELTALTWGDIDFDKKEITVNKACDLKKLCLKQPKTSAGIRTVPIPQVLLDELKEYKKKSKSDLVILNDAGTMMTNSSWMHFNRGLVKRSGVDFTWHMLRHTYATLCYDAGVDAISCSKWCGHSSTRITIDLYTHLSEQKEVSSANKLDSFLNIK